MSALREGSAAAPLALRLGAGRPARSASLRIGLGVMGVAAAVALLAAPWYLLDYLLLLTNVLIIGSLALSLDLVLGAAGIVTLGHAMFFGIGAYTAGIVAVRGMPDPLFGLACAGAVAGLAGLVTSPLIVRGTDLSRLMVTLGLGALLLEAANRLPALTGGADGLQGISMGPLLGVWRFDLYGVVGYFYVLAAAGVLFAVSRVLLRSEWGFSLRALHDQPQRAEALGIPVARRLAGAYTVGACMAGISGALLAQTSQFVGLEILSYGRSAEILIILIVGGIGLGWGGFLGAAVYLVLHEKLSSLAPEYWTFWLGLFLIFMVLVLPEGIGGGVRSLQQRWRRHEGEAP